MIENISKKDWALTYAHLGWYVFPVCWPVSDDGNCYIEWHKDDADPLTGERGLCDGPGKTPLIKWGEGASCDPAKIEAWWSEWPEANIGLHCGKSGVFVVDVEAEGVYDFEKYANQGDGFPETLVSYTGGGGEHFFFQAPKDGRVSNDVDDFVVDHVDIRGDGGFVVLPPSSHKGSSHGYRWDPKALERVRAGRLASPPPPSLLTDINKASGRSGKKGGAGDSAWKNIETLSWEDFAKASFSKGDGRNNQLFAHARKFRDQAANHLIDADEAEIRSVLTDVFVASGLRRKDVRATLDSVFNPNHKVDVFTNRAAVEAVRNMAAVSGSGAGSAVSVPDSPAALFEPGSTTLLAEAPDLEASAAPEPVETGVKVDPALLTATDLGNAYRLHRDHGDNMRLVEGDGWYAWNGYRWVKDDKAPRVAALELPTIVAQEAVDAEDDPDRLKELQNWVKRSGSRAAIRAAVDLWGDFPEIGISADRMDTNLELFMVENGVLNLRTGELRDSRRADNITKTAPVRFDPSAECPRWREFMDTIIDDASTRWFLQKAIGYSLTGLTDAGQFYFLYGGGSNGKSTMLKTLQECLFGTGKAGYSRKAHKSIVVDTHGAIDDTHILALRGVRLAVNSDDIGPGSVLNIEYVKQIATGDLLGGRGKYQASGVEFNSPATLWLAANDKPALRSVGTEIRRRMIPIAFNHSFEASGSKRDMSEVMAEFREESSGILNWALEGLQGYWLEGLEPSTRIEADRDAYLRGQDHLALWIEEEMVICSPERGSGLKVSFIVETYNDWRRRNGLKGLGRNAVKDALDRSGIPRSEVVAGSTAYYGIQVGGIHNNRMSPS